MHAAVNEYLRITDVIGSQWPNNGETVSGSTEYALLILKSDFLYFQSTNWKSRSAVQVLSDPIITPPLLDPRCVEDGIHPKCLLSVNSCQTWSGKLTTNDRLILVTNKPTSGIHALEFYWANLKDFSLIDVSYVVFVANHPWHTGLLPYVIDQLFLRTYDSTLNRTK